jgi:hypothetical protein
MDITGHLAAKMRKCVILEIVDDDHTGSGKLGVSTGDLGPAPRPPCETVFFLSPSAAVPVIVPFIT